jgi:hypothetical protein
MNPGGHVPVPQEKNMQKTVMAVALVAMTTAIGCASGRVAGQYSDETRALLQTKSPTVTDCYNKQLKVNPKAAGLVTVRFTVQKETGTFTNMTIDDSSTAGPVLRECVMTALQGLVLAPADENDGEATFTWDFSVSSVSASVKPSS